MLSMSNGGGRIKGEGWIQSLVSRELYDAPLIGYALNEEINKLPTGRRSIKPRSVYKTLRRREKEDLLNSEWIRGSPCITRRVYSLTDAGMEKDICGERTDENSWIDDKFQRN